jgi:hypothetical protein
MVLAWLMVLLVLIEPVPIELVVVSLALVGIVVLQ